MTVAADQRCCLQIWVVMEVITEILAEVAGGTELDLNCGSGDP